MIVRQAEATRRLILPHTGLRGIAALVVFLAHLGYETKITMGMNPKFFPSFGLANFAVNLFFILSGFNLHWVYFKTEIPIGVMLKKIKV